MWSAAGAAPSLTWPWRAKLREKTHPRDTFEAGDGCAGRGCAAKFQGTRFVKRQRAAADDLRVQIASLAVWSDLVDGSRDGSSRQIIHTYSHAQARDIGSYVLARAGPGARAPRKTRK